MIAVLIVWVVLNGIPKIAAPWMVRPVMTAFGAAAAGFWLRRMIHPSLARDSAVVTGLYYLS